MLKTIFIVDDSGANLTMAKEALEAHLRIGVRLCQSGVH
jgi:hypothetical protein